MASDAAAAWNSHNIQEISKGYTNGATFSGPFMTGPVPAQAMFESLRELFVAVPDARIKVVSAAPAGENMIAEQWVIAGTWTAPFAGGILAGMAPTGKTFILPGASFLHVQGDKIVSEIQYYDQLMYIAQLGILQKP